MSNSKPAVIGAIIVAAVLVVCVLMAPQDGAPVITVPQTSGVSYPTTIPPSMNPTTQPPRRQTRRPRPTTTAAPPGRLIIVDDETTTAAAKETTTTVVDNNGNVAETSTSPPTAAATLNSPTQAAAAAADDNAASGTTTAAKDDSAFVASRPWLQVDLAPFDALSRAIAKHSGLGRDERNQMMIHFARAEHVKTICVVGFNDGASVAVMLKANPKAKVHVIGKGPTFSTDADAFLKNAKETSKYGLGDVTSRLAIYDTPPLTAVRDFVAARSEKCSLVLVHGNGGAAQTEVDIKYMAYAADPTYSVLLVDRTNCDDKACVDAAVAEHLKRGTVRTLGAALTVTSGSSKATQGMTALSFEISPLSNAADLDAIMRGSWRSVDVAPFTKLGVALNDQALTEGHSAQLIAERQIYVKLARMQNVKRICEIGFNGGHSASLWLMANPTAEVIMFDLWEHAYAVTSEQKLRDSAFTDPFGMQNVDKRLRIVKGSSLNTVRNFASENPSIKCDLISVDGGHTYDIAVADIRNMHFLANPEGNVLVVDDSNCESPWCVDKAIEEHQRRGTVRSLFGVSEYGGSGGYGRGVTVLQFITALPSPTAEIEALRMGSWTEAKVSAYESLTTAVTAAIGTKDKPPATRPLQLDVTVATLPFVRRICEVTSSNGTGTAVWLKANPKAEVLVFHTDDASTSAMRNFLTSEGAALDHGLSKAEKRFSQAEKRLTIIKATSPTSIRQYATDRPDLKCDVISFNAFPFDNNAAIATLKTLHYMANPEHHVVVVHHTNCDAAQCSDAAVQEHQRRGSLRSVTSVTDTIIKGGYADGSTVLQYVVNPIEASLSRDDPVLRALRAIQHGSWAKVSLQEYDSLAASLLQSTGAKIEGHSGQLQYERQIYAKLAQMPNVKRICEIGFNGGTSASLWLKANPKAEVLMFDLWAHEYAAQAESYLRGRRAASEHGLVDVDKRLTIVKGSSQVTVRDYFTKHPDVKCDLLSVDGGHTYDMAVADITNMQLLANTDFNVLVVDDTNCDVGYCVDSAIAEHQRRGTMRTLFGVSEFRSADMGHFGRGVTVFQYVTPSAAVSAKSNPKAWRDVYVEEGYAELMGGMAAAAASSDKTPSAAASIVRATSIAAAKQPHVKRICVAGFDRGVLPGHMLLANPTAEVVVFPDSTFAAASHQYLLSDEAAQLGLQKAGSRLVLEAAGSVGMRTMVTKRPEQKCDLVIFPSRDEKMEVQAAELKYALYLVSARHQVVVEHAICAAPTCGDAIIEEAQRRGAVQVLHTVFPEGQAAIQTSATLLRFPAAAAALPRSLARIRDGAWRTVELEDYTALGHAMVAEARLEGDFLTVTASRRVVIALAQMPEVKRICEIGLGAGTGASMYLKANPTAEVLIFDLFQSKHAQAVLDRLASEDIKTKFGLEDVAKRLKVVKGASQWSVRRFAAANPDVKCDLMVLDGAWDYASSVVDIRNMQQLANPKLHVLVVDDSSCDQFWCGEKALEEHEKRGTVRRLFGVSEEFNDQSEVFNRGLTVLQYRDVSPSSL